ncbi:hypothetical protein DES53_101870 [Roseimicrobium gellanilyticum]|uniref:Uncharacterized protein n=1 Tax=Roseimicrobium gellanilyticum TaxID=748857 RepID=A0A366HVX6_9BACT|nr:hypothetical protein [Roseimicrobium gellanilyticum]RBP48070.1 hypothetical protein DES53_101870 [Roseimicrobium gellanilyticum]
MKLSQNPFSRPNAIDRSLQAEVENLRLGLASLTSEPELLNEVALCLAYLSLGEHGRASLALDLVHEYRTQLDDASQHLNAVRKASFDSLLRRIEAIAQIQATRTALQTGMQFHTSHYDRPMDLGEGSRISSAA